MKVKEEYKVGEFVLDTYNEFTKKDFEFIEGESYCQEKALCEILAVTSQTVLVRIEKFPKRIYIHDGGRISKGIVCEQWFKLVREHENEITFSYRFKKTETDNKK